MKILCLHSDFIEVEPKSKALKSAEDVEKVKKRINECLVVFTSVESGDSKDIVNNAYEEINKISEQVKCNNIVIYPFVHLSANPAPPEVAMEILKELEKKFPNVYRAPFGWYKEFTIKCKGHPLAELSREIKTVKKREEVVEKIKKTHFILTEDGEEIKIDLSNEKSLEILDKYPSLKKYVYSDEIKGQPSQEPPSIKAMRRLEMVDYEPASDLGHFRFYPKGNLIFELLKDWAEKIAVEQFKCMQIDTPILYDWNLPDIRSQGESFHERHYSIITEDKKELVLRFAGDFGLFRIMKNVIMSYKQLPVRVYEFSKSFRYEKSGELSGLRRLRAFHMPDIHSFCKDIEQGWEEYQELYKKYDDLAKGTEIEYVIVFRMVDRFYEKYKDKIVELLKYSKQPAFIEVLSDMKHYWAVKHEFQAIDSVSGNTQLSTVQLDVEDAERYGITYTDFDNSKKGCIICHSSIGSIERWIFSILENALKEKTPEFPLWLSPTQVRLCPINDSFVEYCKKLAEEISRENIRVDIDDRKESVQKKVRDSEQEWNPYTVVIGEKEKETGLLPVRFRKTSEVKTMKKEELIKMIKDKTKGFPFRKLAMPQLLSKRPIFVG